jgi:glycosyltransferase involved in cell wall biosynthesis
VRICVIGKFPPIQGGVSMRTYWTAHGLAACGHEVHVVTNAKEARPPFRMHMRPVDWERCQTTYGDGSVTVHWTDPVDASQSYIPMASPFVSKLAALAARVHSERPFDVIYSHYLEPYGVAGTLAAQITGKPHVVRMAGSDAGRLWRHPQFEFLYDHVLRSAEIVIAAGAVAERATGRGVARDRIISGGGFEVPEHIFSPDGPKLDIAALRREAERDCDLHGLLWGDFAADRPYFGIYGKLGGSKGSFALLRAMHRLKSSGRDVGLVALAHGEAAVEDDFRTLVRKLDLTDRILQIPFLPHWRVPEFLRGCLAVCCLEQDFPITLHAPIIPREVLLCGSCLVASTELIRKLPAYETLPHRYGCIAIEDVNNDQMLSGQFASIVDDPTPVKAVGARGRAFVRELQANTAFPQMIERILQAAAARRRVLVSDRTASASADDPFSLTHLAVTALQDPGIVADRPVADPTQARAVLVALEKGIREGKMSLQPFMAAVKTEIAIAEAEREADDSLPSANPHPRLNIKRWALGENDVTGLFPICDSKIRIVEFTHDVSEYQNVRTAADLPSAPRPTRSQLLVFGLSPHGRRSPLLIDGMTVRFLQLRDGSRSSREIVAQLTPKATASEVADILKWIENLFLSGLVRLQDTRVGATAKQLV